MRTFGKRKLLVASALLVGAAGTGAGLAATRAGGPNARSDAIVADAAKQLGIQPQALSAALKKAEEDQVDAAVAAGKLTAQQGDALKAAIESGRVPLVGSGFGHGFVRHALLRDLLTTAAGYLGVTPAQLRMQLMSGKSLAEVATAQSKSVDGLVDALVSAVEKRLDAAVSAGMLSSGQRQTIESSLRQRITDLVNATPPTSSGADRSGFRGFWRAQARPLVRPA